jgi:hypothetical protein
VLEDLLEVLVLDPDAPGGGELFAFAQELRLVHDHDQTQRVLLELPAHGGAVVGCVEEADQSLDVSKATSRSSGAP